MFSCDLNRDHIEAKPERVVSLIKSLNKIDLIPQDGGDGEPEPTEAFIAGVQRAQDQYDIVAYLYHERTHTPRIYVWEDGEVNRANFADVETQALDFIESMGFMMDNTQFRKQSPEQRQELFQSVPVFFEGGGTYGEMLESKADPSLLDLSDDLVDLEENPDAFEEEKKVKTVVDVDAYESRAVDKKHNPFDALETGPAGDEPAKNPFDDFDSGAGSEFDSSAFDDVAQPPSKAAKAAPKAAKAAAMDTAGGSVSEMVEHPDEEAGALDALSGDLDSALTDDVETAEAVEVEDLPETDEIANAEDVEDIAEVTSIPPAAAAEESDGIEIAFDEPEPPPVKKAPPKPIPIPIPLPKASKPKGPPLEPPAARAAGDDAVDFGEIGDESLSMGGGADFGQFLEEKDKPKGKKAAAHDDDFDAIASDGSPDAGDLTADTDDFVGTETPEETPGSAEDLFGDGDDLAADLDKSLDDILSGPPAPKHAAAAAPEAAEEVLDDADLGMQSPEAPLEADTAIGGGGGNGGVEIDFSADEPADISVTPKEPAPEPVKPEPAVAAAAVPEPVAAAPAPQAAVPQLSAEERAARLGIYGKLFATL